MIPWDNRVANGDPYVREQPPDVIGLHVLACDDRSNALDRLFFKVDHGEVFVRINAGKVDPCPGKTNIGQHENREFPSRARGYK